ncbi:adenosine deaminase, partial [Streptomyces scabiei]
DHFFDSFAKFGPLKAVHRAEWVDEVARRAAAQNEQYMELMFTPDFRLAAKLATKIPWTEDFAKLREELLESGLRENVKSAVDEYREADRQR